MSQKTREKYGIRLPVMVDVAAVPAVIEGHGFDKGARVDAVVYAPPPAAVWNGLRRLWMVDGVAVDPQPAAPPAPLAVLEMAPGARGPVPAPPSLSVEASLDSGRHYGPAAALPPSVKVSA